MKSLLILLIVIPIQALAQKPAKTDYWRCRADYLVSCVPATWKQVLERDYFCLRNHLDRVTPECREMLLERSHDPCIKEILKVCPKELWGQLHSYECLREKKSEISVACRKKVEGREAEIAHVDKLCGATFASLCPNLEGTSLLTCQEEALKEKKVPEDCAKALQHQIDTAHK